MGFEGVLNQVFQPYFYYSVVLFAVSFFSVKIVLKYCTFLSNRVRSLISLAPLLIPLFVMVVFVPSTVIKTVTIASGPETFTLGRAMVTSSFQLFRVVPMQSFTYFIPPARIVTETLSVTGVICLLGLVFATIFSSFMMLFGDKLTRRVLHIIELAPEDHPWLQAKILELSGKLAISPPKVGVTEDLRPNAFTMGYGRKTTLIFSAGLLQVLSKEEVAAVALHELAHVKNRDFFYKALSGALVSVSFFNPLAYFASSMGQREREMFADEGATKLLGAPSVLSNALAKASNTLMKLPRESLRVRLTASLFVSSSVLRRPQLLSCHPRLDQRLRNISGSTFHGSKRFNASSAVVAGILILLLVHVGVFACYGSVMLQADAVPGVKVKPIAGVMRNPAFEGARAFMNPAESLFGSRVVEGNITIELPALQVFHARPVALGVVSKESLTIVRPLGLVSAPFTIDISNKTVLDAFK